MDIPTKLGHHPAFGEDPGKISVRKRICYTQHNKHSLLCKRQPFSQAKIEAFILHQ